MESSRGALSSDLKNLRSGAGRSMSSQDDTGGPLPSETPEDLLRRARSYPFPAPDHAFVHTHTEAVPWDGPDLTGRVPVLAIGSNRAPVQLARKFRKQPGAAIPVERARLAGFDICYAAHISAYGSITAALHPVPGCAVELSITWLHADDLPTMHATEGRGVNYDYAGIAHLDLRAEHSGELDRAFVYVCRGGCLAVDGALAGLAEITADGRPHPHLTQPEIQQLVHARLADGEHPDDFILRGISDREEKRRREALLQADAIPFDWHAVDVVTA